MDMLVHIFGLYDFRSADIRCFINLRHSILPSNLVCGLTSRCGFELILHDGTVKGGCIQEHGCCSSHTTSVFQCFKYILFSRNVMPIFNELFEQNIQEGVVGVQSTLLCSGFSEKPQQDHNE